MAASALEEKINKIRQQNEEIRRRYEEVEEDKKKAAKLNALVQMVPSTDWPERKEPLEFANPPRTNNKLKPAKEHHEHSHQYQPTSAEGRKSHTFAQGQGPPPDPKYNFLADAEREEGTVENAKDNLPSKGQKYSKGTFKRKPGGKDGVQRDHRTNRGSQRDEHQPEYEAWRAERNRIDEDRISRQRTAEGNWRREWDNDKAHIVDEMARSEKLGDYVKKDYKDHDRRYHVNGNDYANHNRGGHRSYRGSNAKRFHNAYETRSNNTYQHHDGHAKNSSDERTVVAIDKSIRVTLNQGNATTKGPLMSVKVNSPSIAGTGRVGPRQRSRVTYSSHSDVEITDRGNYHDNSQNSVDSRKSQLAPRRKDLANKSPHFHKKEIITEAPADSPQKRRETESLQENESHSPVLLSAKSEKNDTVTAVSDITSGELDANGTDVASNKNDENHDDDDAKLLANQRNEAQAKELSQSSGSPEPKIETKADENTGSRVNEENHVDVCANKDASRDSPESKVETTGVIEQSEANEESEDVAKRDLSTRDIDGNRNEITSAESSLDRADSVRNMVEMENKDRDAPHERERAEEITSNSCDSERNDYVVKCDMSSGKKADEVAASCSTDVSSAVEGRKNEPEIVDKLTKDKVTENDEIAADETNKWAAMERVDQVSARVDNNDNEEKSNAAEKSLKEEARANEETQ